jgi:hypothetical protein
MAGCMSGCDAVHSRAGFGLPYPVAGRSLRTSRQSCSARDFPSPSKPPARAGGLRVMAGSHPPCRIGFAQPPGVPSLALRACMNSFHDAAVTIRAEQDCPPGLRSLCAASASCLRSPARPGSMGRGNPSLGRFRCCRAFVFSPAHRTRSRRGAGSRRSLEIFALEKRGPAAWDRGENISATEASSTPATGRVTIPRQRARSRPRPAGGCRGTRGRRAS